MCLMYTKDFCHSLVIARIKLEDWVVIVVFSLVVALWQLFRFFPERQGEDGPRLLAPLKAVLNQILQHHRSGTSFRILKTTPNRAFHSGSLICLLIMLEHIWPRIRNFKSVCKTRHLYEAPKAVVELISLAVHVWVENN